MKSTSPLTTLPANPDGNYRWFIMVLGALSNAFVIAAPFMAITVLMPEIQKELTLSVLQSGLLWGASSLPLLFTALVAGNLINRFGTRKILIINIMFVGLASILRGFSDNFNFLTLSVLLAGLFSPLVNISNVVNTMIWFPARERGIANGLATLGMALGFFIGSLVSATVLSPLLGGWRNVFIFYGLVSLLFSVAWMFTKAAPSASPEFTDIGESVSFRQGAKHILGMPSFWLMGIGVLGVAGSVQGLLGYLPIFLEAMKWNLNSSGAVLAGFHICSMIAVLPVSYFAGRHGFQKPVLLVGAAVTAVGIALIGLLNPGLIWLPILATGLLRDSFMGGFFTVLNDSEGIGARYSSQATSLSMIFVGLGNVFAPPIGNSLAKDPSSTLPIFFWAGLALVGLAAFVISFVGQGLRGTAQVSNATKNQ